MKYSIVTVITWAVAVQLGELRVIRKSLATSADADYTEAEEENMTFLLFPSASDILHCYITDLLVNHSMYCLHHEHD